jgi:two-component system sensor histidine kinase KdpD
MGSECEFSVEDEGAGIPKGKEGRIFEGFLQGQKDPGSPGGMGLFIVKAVVEAHGGRVWADCPGDGRGAAFHFTLPMNREGGKLKSG